MDKEGYTEDRYEDEDTDAKWERFLEEKQAACDHEEWDTDVEKVDKVWIGGSDCVSFRISCKECGKIVYVEGAIN